MEEIKYKEDLPEWMDDETMAVLFSPFRESRDVNPNSWDRKLQFWTRLILQRQHMSGQSIIKSKDLPRTFERKGKVPFCLGVVVQDMLKRGQLVRLADFQVAADQGWASWTYNKLIKNPVRASFNLLVKTPFSWTYQKLLGNKDDEVHNATGLSLGGSTDGLNQGQLVLTELVESQANEMLEIQYGREQDAMTDRVVSLDRFRQMCTQRIPNDQSFQLAILWLRKQKKCMIKQEGDQKVLVFAARNQVVNPQTLDTDLQVFRLRNAEEKLHSQIEVIRGEMDKCRLEAKGYLQRGLKTSAKNCLRRKKRLEGEIDKKESAVENIQHLLLTIQQAYTDRQVIDAYSSGVEAFKKLNQKYGLTTEMVDDVMIGVQEVLENQEEMNRSISAPIMPNDISAEDLEAELDEILEQTSHLPAIPNARPFRDPHVPAVATARPVHDPHVPSRPVHDPRVPSATLDQEMVDSLCTMRLAEDDLPNVPTHSPDSSLSWQSRSGMTSSPVGLITPPQGFGYSSSMSATLPSPPVGFGSTSALPSPPVGFGTALPSPPRGYEAMPPSPPRGFGATQPSPPRGLEHKLPSPPGGFGFGSSTPPKKQSKPEALFS